MFGGDVLIHQAVWTAAAADAGYDFSAMLEPVQDLLTSADLAICHLEGTLGAPDVAPAGFPRFRAPASLAVDLEEAGFDGCSLSSNHGYDFGAEGIAATIAGFDAADLLHAGTTTTPDGTTAARYDANGIVVVQLSYSYGSNGAILGTNSFMMNIIDPVRILADASAAREAGAQFVAVSLHWGTEYDHRVSTAQKNVAEALAAQPGVIDLVVGHHAHVVQPIAKIGEMWVAFGMGNMLSNNFAQCCRNEVIDGVLVNASIEADGSGKARLVGLDYTPTWNERGGFRVVGIEQALASGTSGVDPKLLRASFERTTAYVTGANGEAGAGETIAARQLAP